MVNARAVEVPEALDLRKLIDDPGCEQQDARAKASAVPQLNLEAAAGQRIGIQRETVTVLHPVGLQLLACDAQKLERRDSIARQVAVRSSSPAVAWFAVVDDDGASPGSPEYQRGA